MMRSRMKAAGPQGFRRRKPVKTLKGKRMRKISILFWMMGLVAGWWWSPATGATREFGAAKDNTLFDLTPDTLSNGAGPYFFVGENSQGNTRRAVITFAVDSLPAEAVIDSVELRLRMSQSNNNTARVIELHRLTSDWGEGDSFSDGGSGAAPEAGDATWLHRFFPDQFWTTPGGDFVSTVSAATFVGGVGTYRWFAPGMTADVQAWLDQPASNFGWILIGDESLASTVRRFDSSDNTTAANRPVLVVHYSTDVPVRSSTWGGLKARSRGPE
jgi:hypothetical protein